MQVGRCGLCLKKTELKKSHLMPKALYKKIRNSHDGGDIVLLQSHNKTALYSDYQITAYFLCNECENRFSRLGENIVIPDCCAGKKKFPILQWARSCNVYAEVNGESWVNPIINSFPHIDEYLYFAASVIWRSSAWPVMKNANTNSLGKMYQEEFRRFLFGLDAFPNNAYLAVYLDTDEESNNMITSPTSSKKVGYHHHIFYIPGMKFSMLIGNDVSSVKNAFCDAGCRLLFSIYSFTKHSDSRIFSSQWANEFCEKGRLAAESKNV